MQIYKSTQSVNMIRPDSNILDAVTYYALEYFSLGSNWRSIEVTEGRLRPHGSSEPPLARTGQHPWLCPTDKDILLREPQLCEDNKVAFTHVQPHYYCLLTNQGDEAMHSSRCDA